MLLKWDSFLKCSLAFRKVWDALKPPSLLLRQQIKCWSVVAKFLAAFSMFSKSLTQSALTGFFTNYFLELGIKGRMWLAIRSLYTNVKAQVFYEGSLSRKIDISQGTGQGHILAPFMYKVYVNGLLNVLSNHCYAILMDYAFPVLHLLMRYLYLRCTRPFSRRL